VNWAADGPRLDWVQAYENDAAEPKKLARFTELTNEVQLQIGGWMDLDVFGFVMAYGGFTLFQGQMQVNDDSYDSEAGTGIEPFQANVLSWSLENVSLFAGSGGAFIREAGVPRDFDRDHGAVGFYVSDVTLWLSILQNVAAPAQKYVGLEFSLNGLGLEGIPGLTFNVFDGSLMVNWAAEGERLDWTVATTNDQTHDRYERLADFTDLTKAMELQIGGRVDLNVFGYVLAVGGFLMVKQDVRDLDDPDDAGSLTLGGSLLTVDIGFGQLLAGSGAVLKGGTLDKSHAVGFEATDGRLDLALLTTDEAMPRTYVGLEASLGTAAVLGFGDLALSVQRLYVKFNLTSVAAGRPLDWSAVSQTPVDLTSSDRWSVGGHLTLGIADVVFLSAGFDLQAGTIDVDVNNDGVFTPTAIDLDDAGLVTLDLEIEKFFAGVGASFDAQGHLITTDAVGFELSSGRLALAVIKPQAVADDRWFLALQAGLGGATMAGLPDDLVIAATNLAVAVNQAFSPSDPDLTALDWARQVGDYDAAAGVFTRQTVSVGQSGEPMDILLRGDLLRAGGTLTLHAFGFLQATASFEFVSRQIDVDCNADGRYVASDGDLADANLTALCLQISDFFVGMADRSIGFHLGFGSLVLALITPQDPADGRTYTAIRADLGGASLVGIEGLTLTAEALSLEINRAASGADLPPTALDWTTQVGRYDDARTSFTPETITLGSPGQEIDFSGERLQVCGAMFLALGDYVFARGQFAFQKGAAAAAVLNDDTPTEVTYLTVGAAAVDVFVGCGPYFQDSDGDGQIDDDPAEGAIGLALENASLALAFVKSDTHRYYGLSATLETADIVGLDAVDEILDLDVRDIVIQVNGGNDGDRVVDFARSNLDGDGDRRTRVRTGPGAADFLDLDFADRLLKAAATATLKIDDFVFLEGSFAFLSLPQYRAALSDASTADVAVFALAAADVNAFAGIGPYDFDPDADNADAVGLVVDNLAFSFAVLQDKAMPTHKYYALKGSADNVALHGIPGVTIGVEDLVVEVNSSSHVGPGGERVVVDFSDDPLVVDPAAQGIPVINFAGELIRVSLAQGTFVLADFVYLSGNFAFEKGPLRQVDVATNIPGDFAALVPAAFQAARLENVEVTTLYLGASNVNGFVGLHGPYAGTDAGGAAVVNQEAVGLAVEDLDFGFVIMEPTLGAFPGLQGVLPKFYALQASSDRVALVGVPDVTLEATDIRVAVNFGNAWVKGVESSGRPVVDFAASFPAETTDSDGDGKIDPAGFELNTGHAPVYIDHAGELLIGASVGQAILHLAQFVHLSGSLAFSLGPTYTVTVDAGIPAEIRTLLLEALDYFGVDQTLQDLLDLLGLDLAAGTLAHEVISLTVGGSDINAFVGTNGPYWTDLDADGAISFVVVEEDAGADTYRTLTADVDEDGYIDVVTVDGKKYGDINKNGIVDANETAELNEEAVGLVAADIDFGMAILQSNNPIFDLLRDVIGRVVNVIPGAGQIASVLATAIGEYLRPRYYALKGTAGQVGFVGLD
ncbi:MAG: hypothetical protein MUC88_27740, partial [Planctomycetes bacterium]|nr:hypothetical protein [Planctomycetota bacterium]